MASARPIRILIVDDSAVMRSLLRSVIATDHALEVAATAADGAAALSSLELRRLGQAPPEVILLDVEMPIMDGLVTLRQLRQRGHKMPVIMITTEGAAAKVQEAVARGATGYVRKPFTAEQIKEKLTGLL